MLTTERGLLSDFHLLDVDVFQQSYAVSMLPESYLKRQAKGFLAFLLNQEVNHKTKVFCFVPICSDRIKSNYFGPNVGNKSDLTSCILATIDSPADLAKIEYYY